MWGWRGVSNEFITHERPAKAIRVADSEPATNMQVLSCNLKLVKLSAVCINERLFQTAEAQHENRRAAMFVDEDCVDSRSDVDDLRTHDCLYVECRQVRYEGCCMVNGPYICC